MAPFSSAGPPSSAVAGAHCAGSGSLWGLPAAWRAPRPPPLRSLWLRRRPRPPLLLRASRLVTSWRAMISSPPRFRQMATRSPPRFRQRLITSRRAMISSLLRTWAWAAGRRCRRCPVRHCTCLLCGMAAAVPRVSRPPGRAAGGRPNLPTVVSRRSRSASYRTEPRRRSGGRGATARSRRRRAGRTLIHSYRPYGRRAVRALLARA